MTGGSFPCGRLVGALLTLVMPLGALAAPGQRSVQQALLEIHQHDAAYALPAQAQESLDPGGALLFVDLPADHPIHPSYEATVEFCGRFDPYNRSDDEVSDAEIDAYLAGLLDMAPIQEAFRVTGHATVEDLRAAWFRQGRGFEHVVCGEKGSGMKLGGFHFWYLHYRYEREDRASYLGADYGSFDPDSGLADTRIVTGRMTVDPDGPGGYPPLAKVPRGGFTVGHSVAALLAAGHLAAYGGLGHEWSVTDADDPALASPLEGVIDANLNGKTYPWTFHREGSTVRTLWPRFVPGVLAVP